MVPGAASADFLTFTVNEGSVPGAIPNLVTANDINGRYTEALNITGATFTASAFANFGQFFEGAALQSSQLNNITPNGYGLYALFNSGGTVTGPFPVPPAGTFETDFTGNSGNAFLYIDPNRDTTLGFNGAGQAAVTGG